MWWDRKGILNLPFVVFSAPTKSPRQKALIASGATQAATALPLQRQRSQAPTDATSHTPPIKTALCPIFTLLRFLHRSGRRSRSRTTSAVLSPRWRSGNVEGDHGLADATLSIEDPDESRFRLYDFATLPLVKVAPLTAPSSRAHSRHRIRRRNYVFPKNIARRPRAARRCAL
jgi:hypothetical protein